MPQASQPIDEKLLLCARLADYAYTSGDPAYASENPEDFRRALEAKWPRDYRLENPELFFTHSWFHQPKSQHWFFKSHAYVCQLKKGDGSDDVNQIVVGFRGTWLHQSKPGERASPNAPEGAARSCVSYVLSKLSNLILDVFGPSNYGLADLYYDATLIRVPYRTGVVWKWYTYWGTLVLEGSNWMRGCFAWPRRVAAGLIFRPDGYVDAQPRYPLVHLGFWALWASPEGFAGYDRDGQLRNDQKTNDSQGSQSPSEQGSQGSQSPGVLQCLQSKLQAVQGANGSQETEILVVGHSLGGAVSCFAALDIVEKVPNVKVFHATFGAPPVGTKVFAELFRNKMNGHESWAVFHERDKIAKCFAWCGSIPVVKRLGWWSNWSRAGKMFRKLGDPVLPDSERQTKFSWRVLLTPDGLKSGLILVGTIIFLVFSLFTTPLSMVIAPVCWLVDGKYYEKQKNPPANWEDDGSQDDGSQDDGSQDDGNQDSNLTNLGLEYHELENYIKLLKGSGPFGVPENESNGPSAVDRE